MAIILGIHMGHDASISVIEDGVATFCLSEERLAREKLYYGFPLRSLKLAMEWTNTSPDQIDVLAMDTLELPQLLGPKEMKLRFNLSKTKKMTKQLLKGRKVLDYFLGKKSVENELQREHAANKVLKNELKKLDFRLEQFKMYDHHLAHAASAFWPSPFSEALIVTSDGRGDGNSASIGYGKGYKISPKLNIGELDSIGQFYAAVTFYLGFSPNRHEGKITGLAAHGDKMTLGSEFLKCVTYNKNGSYNFRIPDRYKIDTLNDFDEQFDKIELSLKDRIILHSQSDISTLLFTTKWYQLLAYLHDVSAGKSKEDVAAGVQYLAEEVCSNFVKNNLPNHATPVALAGGVFANVRVNQKIRELSGVSNVYVQPAMGDQGLSLGAALLAHAEFSNNDSVRPSDSRRDSQMDNVYLGPEYSKEDILNACKQEHVEVQQVIDIEDNIGKWIHEGFIIGYFQGRMEFGPRALGHRSILARPIEGEINNVLNNRLKRTEFMPFAPSIISEHAHEYFDGYEDNHVASEYMTMTYDVAKDMQKHIPAVVHVDGTARPQVVKIEHEPTYHRIISAYHKYSGIPLIINTSFNTHEEPIVCTPRDAILTYKTNAVDILVMENYVLGANEND